jgi:hypothetical protein
MKEGKTLLPNGVGAYPAGTKEGIVNSPMKVSSPPRRVEAPEASDRYPAIVLHPAWRNFVRYCAELRYGEIERLSIQDGMPVLAEVVKKKIKFA